jgi:hypothetical protein
MSRESEEPTIVDLAAYRAARTQQQHDEEVTTDIHLCVTRSGKIVPSVNRVSEMHALNVLVWCMSIQKNVLDMYIESLA